VITGQENGFLQVIEVPNLKIISTSQVASGRDVNQVTRTKRGELNNSVEICFVEGNGMFFGNYDETFSFAENREEFYFIGRNVPSFFEYEVDKFVCGIWNDLEYVQVIDRSKK